MVLIILFGTNFLFINTFRKKKINCACNVSNLLTKMLTEISSFEEKSIRFEYCHEQKKNISVTEISSYSSTRTLHFTNIYKYVFK